VLEYNKLYLIYDELLFKKLCDFAYNKINKIMSYMLSGNNIFKIMNLCFNNDSKKTLNNFSKNNLIKKNENFNNILDNIKNSIDLSDSNIDSDDDSVRKIDPNIRTTNSDNLVSTIPIKSQKKTIISKIEDVASSAVGTARKIFKLPQKKQGGLKYQTKLRAHLRKTHKITKRPKYINNNVTKRRR
jgi:uncharacterized protein (UPF0297 family)